MAFVDLHAQRARLGPRIDAAVARVLSHGQFVMGPEVDQLESELAAYTGARHVVSCGSGTDALLMALLAIGVRPGDAVLVPSFTFAATAGAVAVLGGTPVFVDCALETFDMDPKSLAAAIDTIGQQGLRPRAVVPVDLFGHPADYDAISDVAAAAGLTVIADAAQSFGATWRAARVGTLAPITATSFFPAKPLGCYGDGGALFADDHDLAEVLRSIRVHGEGATKYDNVRIGLNGRLDTLQAAILLEKLAIFDDELDRRRRIAERYAEALADVAVVPRVHPHATTSWAVYTVRLDDPEALAARLSRLGVPSAAYYRVPLHRQPAYASFPTAPGGLPVTERLAAEVLSLPIHPYLDETAQDRVIDAVLSRFGRNGS